MADNIENPGSNSESTPFSSEQVSLITQVVNAAITSHLKRQPDVKQLITEALSNYKPPVSEPSSDEPGKKSGKIDPQLTALQAKHEELIKALASAEEKRVAAERNARDNKAFSDLKSALTGKVRSGMEEAVAKLLYHVDKRTEIDEQGNVLLKVRRAPAQGFPEEDQLMPLTDGIEAYLKTKDAAPFIPAQASVDSKQPARGSRMPTPPPRQQSKYDQPAKSDDEKIRRAMEAEAALKATGNF